MFSNQQYHDGSHSKSGNPNLLGELKKNYQCDLKETTDSASGKPQVKCTHKQGDKEYVIFRTKAACEFERETQISNGD
jgi:hypothetical protein